MFARRCCLAIAAAVCFNSVTFADEEVTLTVGTVEDLTTEIAKHQGKVVVVDFWADFCIPCKKEFPNLVKLQQAHKGELTAISVSFDDPEDKDIALKFLKDNRAVFPNILLEDPTPAQDKWDFTAIPTTLVFGRDGKLAKKFSYDNIDDQFTYEDVEKFVEPLVKVK